MRQELQVYVTIKKKVLNQIFEESDGGDQPMGFVVITIKIHRFSVCDSNIWIGVNPRVVVAPFARRHL